MQQLTKEGRVEDTFYPEISSGNWLWHAKYINNEAMFWDRVVAQVCGHEICIINHTCDIKGRRGGIGKEFINLWMNFKLEKCV